MQRVWSVVFGSAIANVALTVFAAGFEVRTGQLIDHWVNNGRVRFLIVRRQEVFIISEHF